MCATALANQATSLPEKLDSPMLIEKYTTLMERYLDKITPQVSGTWRADESSLNVTKSSVLELRSDMQPEASVQIVGNLYVYSNQTRI
jgi:hypothetical protein